MSAYLVVAAASVRVITLVNRAFLHIFAFCILLSCFIASGD